MEFLVLLANLEQVESLDPLVSQEFQELKVTWEHLDQREAQDFKGPEDHLESLDDLVMQERWAPQERME